MIDNIFRLAASAEKIKSPYVVSKRDNEKLGLNKHEVEKDGELLREILQDGEWHHSDKVYAKLNISKSRMERAVNFIYAYKQAMWMVLPQDHTPDYPPGVQLADN